MNFEAITGSRRAWHRYFGGYAGLAFRAGLSVAIVGFLLWRYQPRLVLRPLAAEQPRYFVAALCVFLGTQFLAAYRWHLLVAISKIRAPFMRVLTFRLIATFVNSVLPGVISGDVVRAVYLARRSNSEVGPAMASVIADRIIGLIGLLWLAAFAALFLSPKPLPFLVTSATVAAASLALFIPAAIPLIDRLVPLLPSVLVRHGNAIVACLRQPGQLIISLSLSVAFQIGLAICQYLLARGIGLNAPLILYLVCVPIAGVFASLPLTINGLGVRDSVYLMLFGYYGVTPQNAVALGLLWFICTTAGAVPGLVAFAAAPLPRVHLSEYSRDIAARAIEETK